jgi:hypothetical protein
MAMTCERVRELAPGFVLGALETDEMIAVQDHLDSCEKPHLEVDELGGVVPYLAQTVAPVEPPAWLRESVLAAAKADSAARRRVGKAAERRIAEPSVPVNSAATAVEDKTQAPALQVAALPANVVPLRGRLWASRRRIATWSARAAAAMLIVVLGGYAAVVQNELNNIKAAEPTSIVRVIGPDTRQAVLTPTTPTKGTGGLAVLQPTGHIYLEVHGLPATTGDQVYTVWASAADGKVSKIGVFTIDATGSGYVQFDSAPNSGSLWLFVAREANTKVATPSGPIVLSGTLSR